jgi:hypothetical protein
VRRTLLLASFILAGTGTVRADGLTAKQIIDRLLAHDFWGLSGAEVKAAAELKDMGGTSRSLQFTAISRKRSGDLTQSLVRFSAPPDLAGAGFLQTQNGDRDDDRFLYLPSLKRSRRVAASQRSTSFMGTDFNFADLDRRDYRESTATKGGDSKVLNFDCYEVTVVPRRKDSPYSKIVLSVRKDNFVPLKVLMHDRSGSLEKTLQVQQLKRISGRWFTTKSLMTDHKRKHTTLLVFQKVTPRDDVPASEFTVERLEK